LATKAAIEPICASSFPLATGGTRSGHGHRAHGFVAGVEWHDGLLMDLLAPRNSTSNADRSSCCGANRQTAFAHIVYRYVAWGHIVTWQVGWGDCCGPTPPAECLKVTGRP